MAMFLALVALPLVVVLAGVWFFLAARRSKSDETGREETKARSTPRLQETRAHGRET